MGGPIIAIHRAVPPCGSSSPPTASACRRPGTGVLHYNVGSGWQSTPMTVISADVYDAVLPAAACGATVLYYAQRPDRGRDDRDRPSLCALAVSDSTAVGYGVAAFFQNDLSSSPGCRRENLRAFGHPTGGGSHNHDPEQRINNT